jgi:hypothetical protein
MPLRNLEWMNAFCILECDGLNLANNRALAALASPA